MHDDIRDAYLSILINLPRQVKYAYDILVRPGRWYTTTPSLQVNYDIMMIINPYTIIRTDN